MGCNCKTREKTSKLIKNVEDINKSSSKNYTNRNRNLNKIIIQTLKMFLYSICYLILVITIIPILLYGLLGKKIVIKIPLKKILHGKQINKN